MHAVPWATGKVMRAVCMCLTVSDLHGVYVCLVDCVRRRLWALET